MNADIETLEGLFACFVQLANMDIWILVDSLHVNEYDVGLHRIVRDVCMLIKLDG